MRLTTRLLPSKPDHTRCGHVDFPRIIPYMPVHIFRASSAFRSLHAPCSLLEPVVSAFTLIWSTFRQLLCHSTVLRPVLRPARDNGSSWGCQDPTTERIVFAFA